MYPESGTSPVLVEQLTMGLREIVHLPWLCEKTCLETDVALPIACTTLTAPAEPL